MNKLKLEYFERLVLYTYLQNTLNDLLNCDDYLIIKCGKEYKKVRKEVKQEMKSSFRYYIQRAFDKEEEYYKRIEKITHILEFCDINHDGYLTKAFKLQYNKYYIENIYKIYELNQDNNISITQTIDYIFNCIIIL